jgi:hypothetical protein
MLEISASGLMSGAGNGAGSLERSHRARPRFYSFSAAAVACGAPED